MFLLNRSRCDDLHQDCLRQRRHVLCKTTHDGHEKAPVVIVGTPKIDDYADSQLPEEDFPDPSTGWQRRHQAEPADDRKLLAEVDWTKPAAKVAVEDVLRQLAYGYVTGYLENGN